MSTNKLSDLQITITVIPRSARWPASGTSIAWTKAHACVDALRDVVRGVDIACTLAEEDGELSAGGVARHRAALCDRALRKLIDFRPFEIAEEALTENIVALERLRDRDPEQVQMLQKLKQALTDLREGVPATQRMLQERCRVPEGVRV